MNRQSCRQLHEHVTRILQHLAKTDPVLQQMDISYAGGSFGLTDATLKFQFRERNTGQCPVTSSDLEVKCGMALPGTKVTVIGSNKGAMTVVRARHKKYLLQASDGKNYVADFGICFLVKTEQPAGGGVPCSA